jgi:hypothetical protein
MIDSLLRIIIIGRNTLTEAMRQRVLSVLLLFGLVLVGSSVFFSSLLLDEQIKFVKDFGCGDIGLFGFAIALLSTAQLIPQELHNRTIYTILAKPVRRAEFLFGKFLGVVLLLALSVTLMTLVFAGALYWQSQAGISSTEASYASQTPQWRDNPQLVTQYNRDIADIETQVRDPQLIAAILLIFAKLVMTSGIALLISTFATSSIFTIVTTFMIYLIGHMETVAREVWLARGAETTLWQTGFVGFISILIPDMNAYTIVDEILAGNRIPWSQTVDLLGYAGVYLIVLLGVSELLFRHREL